jgi:gas vesicle protein
MSNKTTTVVALLAGLAAGAALGLLLAPQSGKETRDKLKRKAREAKDRAEELLKEGREKFNEAKSQAADAVNKAGKSVHSSN